MHFFYGHAENNIRHRICIVRRVLYIAILHFASVCLHFEIDENITYINKYLHASYWNNGIIPRLSLLKTNFNISIGHHLTAPLDRMYLI